MLTAKTKTFFWDPI